MHELNKAVFTEADSSIISQKTGNFPVSNAEVQKTRMRENIFWGIELDEKRKTAVTSFVKGQKSSEKEGAQKETGANPKEQLSSRKGKKR